MSDDFPFRVDLAQQRIEFTLAPSTRRTVSREQAVEVAVHPWPREQWPAAQAEAWLGHFTQCGGDWRPLPGLDHRLIWLIRFAPIQERRIGRGGSSRVSTEQWIVLDAISGKVLQRFSFR